MTEPSNPIETVSEMVEEKKCGQCGSPLTARGICARTVGLFNQPHAETLDPVIADLISKHITPSSAVGKLIAERIRHLVEEARKEERRYVLDQTSNFFGDDR